MKCKTRFLVFTLIAACYLVVTLRAQEHLYQVAKPTKVPPVSGGATIIFPSENESKEIYHLLESFPNFFIATNWSNIPVCMAIKPQTETGITISPTDPANLVSVWIDLQRSTDVQLIKNAGYGYTVNGGLNWQTGLITAPYDDQFDPSIAADKNGNFYYCFDAQNGGYWYDQPNKILIFKNSSLC